MSAVNQGKMQGKTASNTTGSGTTPPKLNVGYGTILPTDYKDQIADKGYIADPKAATSSSSTASTSSPAPQTAQTTMAGTGGFTPVDSGAARAAAAGSLKRQAGIGQLSTKAPK